MSTIEEKISKQLRYQFDEGPEQSFVSVTHLTSLISEQARLEEKRVRPRVKAELERLADKGVVCRWLDRWAGSNRPERVDHYFITTTSKEDL